MQLGASGELSVPLESPAPASLSTSLLLSSVWPFPYLCILAGKLSRLLQVGGLFLQMHRLCGPGTNAWCCHRCPWRDEKTRCILSNKKRREACSLGSGLRLAFMILLLHTGVHLVGETVSVTVLHLEEGNSQQVKSIRFLPVFECRTSLLHNSEHHH